MEKHAGQVAHFEKKKHGIFVRLPDGFREEMEKQLAGLSPSDRASCHRAALRIGYSVIRAVGSDKAAIALANYGGAK